MIVFDDDDAGPASCSSLQKIHMLHQDGSEIRGLVFACDHGDDGEEHVGKKHVYSKASMLIHMMYIVHIHGADTNRRVGSDVVVSSFIAVATAITSPPVCDAPLSSERERCDTAYASVYVNIHITLLLFTPSRLPT